MVVGEIMRGDDQLFFDRVMEVKECDALVVDLVSPGGDLRVAIQIGLLIRALHLTTQAPEIFGQSKHPYCSIGRGQPPREDEKCVCGSACFFIWAAGSERGGEAIYIHRPYIDPMLYRDLAEKTPEAYGEVFRVARA
jgi:hypothetical protein